MTTQTNKPLKAITLYRNAKSGHCHRVQLMLEFLRLPYKVVEVDMANAAHKEPLFLSMNIFGQVPVIDDDGTIVSDSNGILVYLISQYAANSDWLGNSPVQKAQIQRWFSVAAGELAYGPAHARLVSVFGASIDHELAKRRAHNLLTTMDAHLSDQSFLVGDAISAADVSCYSYIAHAPEGEVGLSAFPHVQGWLKRIEKQAQFVAMASSPVLAQ